MDHRPEHENENDRDVPPAMKVISMGVTTGVGILVGGDHDPSEGRVDRVDWDWGVGDFV